MGRSESGRASVATAMCDARFTRRERLLQGDLGALPDLGLRAPGSARSHPVLPGAHQRGVSLSRGLQLDHAHRHPEARSCPPRVVRAPVGLRAGHRSDRRRRCRRGRGHRGRSHGAVLGRGLYTPRSAIPVRLFTRDDSPIDGAVFRRRIERALAHRREIGLPSAVPGHETDAFRLVHAEGDGLPSLTIDMFADVAVVQLNTIGVKLREGVVFDALQATLAPRAIIDRTPAAQAKMEGFEPAAGVVRGDRTVDALRFQERGLRYGSALAHTEDGVLLRSAGAPGARRAARARAARARRLLVRGELRDGGGARGAAEVVAVDESAVAVEIGADARDGTGSPIASSTCARTRARPSGGLAARRLRPRHLRSAQARALARRQGRRARRLRASLRPRAAPRGRAASSSSARAPARSASTSSPARSPSAPATRACRRRSSIGISRAGITRCPRPSRGAVLEGADRARGDALTCCPSRASPPPRRAGSTA